MELKGARILVCGASGVLGGYLTRALVAAGSNVIAAGRNPERLAEVAEVTGRSPLAFDVVDADSCQRTVRAAVAELGGLDALVVTTGVASFGPAVEADPTVVEELFAVNTLGPMMLVRAAAPHLEPGGTAVVLSAILADLPTAGMAEYSAAKSALATWLGVLRRENRRRFDVLDVRPPHLETGLAERALAGDPPRMPEGFPIDVLVDTVLEAMRSGAKEVVFTPSSRQLTVN